MSTIPGNRRGRRRRGLPLGARRPLEWFDGSTTGAEDPENPTCVDLGKFYNCGRHVFALLQKVDLEHLDKNEVTIERVIGNIWTNHGPVIDPPGIFPTWASIRYGLLVVEEVEDLSTWPIPDLRDPVALDDYEWMWLGVAHPEQQDFWITQAEPGVPDGKQSYISATQTVSSISFDIRVKRKIGKSDSLVMVRFMPNPAGFASDDPTATYVEHRMIRVLTKN